MSNYNLSVTTMAEMAHENQLSGTEFIQETANTVISGYNESGLDTQEQAIAGAEVASRTSEFYGAGTDLGSTGTDIDVAQAVNTSLLDGQGMITDKVV